MTLPFSELARIYAADRHAMSNSGKIPKIPDARRLSDLARMLENEHSQLLYGVDDHSVQKIFMLYTEPQHRGQGSATALLKTFLQYCDDQNKVVYCDPCPFRFCSESQYETWKETGSAGRVILEEKDSEKVEQLTRWYNKFGFVESDKLNKNWLPGITYYLVRHPPETPDGGCS